MTSIFGARGSDQRCWRGHRVIAGIMRVVIVAVPLLVSVVAGVVVAWAVPGGGIPVEVVRVVAAGIGTIVTFIAGERCGRRLVPLAVLLRLSFVFPDRAPSRFSVALRSTSVRRLQEWARECGDQKDVMALAEKVVTLATALNFHDRRTRGHSERTRAMAELLIEELRLPETEANAVRWGAFLHDIGKLLVPAALLNKPGAPTAREWEELRRHPAEGERIVRALRPFLGAGVDAVWAHHESYDGTGYPLGLRGDEIPFAARLVAVADSFEVMTAVRSYKRPMSVAAARAELVRESGKQFDPSVVRAFLNVSLGRLHWAIGVAAWLAEVPFLGLVPRAAAQVVSSAGAGGSVLATATLSGVATASLGATLVANPVLAHLVPAAAATPVRVPAVASATASVAGSAAGTAPPAPTPPPRPRANTTASTSSAAQHGGTYWVAAVPGVGAGSQRPSAPAGGGASSAARVGGIGHAATAPGSAATAPGHAATAPGSAATAPGHAATAPGQSAPAVVGQATTRVVQAVTAVGQAASAATGGATMATGSTTTAAGQTVTNLGNAVGNVPGHALGSPATVPGNSATTPGPAGPT